jgi:hypothetical protein
MKRAILPLVLGLTFTLVTAVAQDSPTASSAEYRPGQVWDYKTARGTEGSRIVILDVQSQGNKGNLVHIRIENIPIPGCGGLRLTTVIQHLAVPEKVLRKSTTDLVSKTELPEGYFEGYRQWQKDRHKQIIKRPLAEVALPEPGCPVIVNLRQIALTMPRN